MATKLVKRGDLDQVITELLQKEEQNQKDLITALQFISEEKLRKILSQRLSASNDCITALRAGFIPVEGQWFWKVSTKSKRQSKWVKEVTETMPEEVKVAWDRIKELNLFKDYGVNGGRLGDPILAGKLGKQYFFIASWINFPNNLAIGFIAKQGNDRRRELQ